MTEHDETLTIRLPKPTQDQLDYLADLHKKLSTYDPSTIIGGPHNETLEPMSIEELEKIPLLPCPFCAMHPQRSETVAWCSGYDGNKHREILLTHEQWQSRPAPAQQGAAEAVAYRIIEYRPEGNCWFYNEQPNTSNTGKMVRLLGEWEALCLVSSAPSAPPAPSDEGPQVGKPEPIGYLTDNGLEELGRKTKNLAVIVISNKDKKHKIPIYLCQPDSSDALRVLKDALIYARDIAQRWAHTQGNNAEWHKSVLAPIDAAIALAQPGEKDAWQDISTAPKFLDKNANVPLEFVIDLYDPDNDIDNRVQVAMWNANYDDWQSLFEHTEIIRPTHWRPRPKPPLSKGEANG